MNTQTSIRLTRTDYGYMFTNAQMVCRISQFRSAYGDLQWGGDIEWLDGRPSTEYIQTNTLSGIRATLAYITQ